MRSGISVWRGIKAMDDKSKIKLGWEVVKMPGMDLWRRWGFWAHWWTPAWHRGRGPYVSIGLGVIAIYRGY